MIHAISKNVQSIVNLVSGAAGMYLVLVRVAVDGNIVTGL
jgi:hypothetical protein